MSGSRKHGAPDRYNRAEVATRGLACPFANSDRVSTDVCKLSEGFKEPRLLFEHIWRKHTRFYQCGFCSTRWSISTPRREVKQKKEKHWKGCDGKLRGKLYFDEADEGNNDLLDWKQQELFEKIKSIRDVGAKLKALYEACGKPVPRTYYATTVLPEVKPQMTYGHSSCTAPHRGQHSASRGGGIFEGFEPPSSDPRPPQKRTTATNLSQASAASQAGDSSRVSGLNRAPDQDSGYASMPKDKRDIDDVLYAGRLPVQPGTYWAHDTHDSRPYGLRGDHVVTVSPGHITNDDHFPIHAGDHLVQGCYGGYDATDPLLALSSPGPQTSEEPLNLDFDFVDLGFPG